MIEFFLSPWFEGAWLWRALATGALVSVSCSVVGVFLYLRSMSMVADALAHIALPGILLAFVITGGLDGVSMLVGAALVGVVATLAMEALGRRRVRRDAAIGIVFTVAFSLGVIALSTVARGVHIDVDCVLFGNILGVSDGALTRLAVVTALVVGGAVAFRRVLGLAVFDPAFARTIGLPVVALQHGMMGASSLTIVAAFEAVGAILGVAMVIVPAATAHHFARDLRGMLGFAVAHALLATVIGVYASVAFDCSTAGAVVVSGAVLYAAAVLLAPRHGVFARRFARQAVGPD